MQHDPNKPQTTEFSVTSKNFIPPTESNMPINITREFVTSDLSKTDDNKSVLSGKF